MFIYAIVYVIIMVMMWGIVTSVLAQDEDTDFTGEAGNLMFMAGVFWPITIVLTLLGVLFLVSAAVTEVIIEKVKS